MLLCFAAVTIVLLRWAKPQRNHGHRQSKSILAWDGFAAANKIAPWVMEHTANGQEAEFFVVLADQADLSLAQTFPTKAEKGRFVYQTLRNKSQTTQGRFCNGCVIATSSIARSTVVNAILVKGRPRGRRSVGGPPGRGASRRQSADP